MNTTNLQGNVITPIMTSSSKKKVFSFKTMDMISASTILSKVRNIGPKQVASILEGSATAQDITSYENYESIFSLRHDAIHWLICEYRELPFGEKPIKDFRLNDLVTNHPHYNLIKEQTPDIFTVDGKQIRISELTISRMKQADIPKITKYRLLVDILKKGGYDVDMEVIIINSAFSIPDRNFLETEYDFSAELIDKIYQIIQNTDNILHLVNQSKYGPEWSAKFRGLMLETVDFGITDEDVLDFHDKVINKTFNSQDDLKTILESKHQQTLTTEDDLLIDKLVDEALGVSTKLTRNQSVSVGIEKLIKYHESNKNGFLDDDLRSFMPLPYFTQLTIDSSKRSTWADGDQHCLITGALSQCNDPVLVKLSKMKSNTDVVRFDENDRFNIALEGPGRKKFVMKGSIPHLKSQMKWKNHWIPLNQPFNDHIEEMSYLLSSIDHGSTSPLDIHGLGIDYIKTCQSIFRELNINSLRKERRKCFILKPTGVAGLFVAIHPGAKLRTGENLSTIWFKLILLKDYLTNESRLSRSWIFKTLIVENTVFHSKWLSTDAHRLDHYIRCYDKIMMAYLCYSSLGDRSLLASSTTNNSNTLGIIMMIYMEDKRSTSKMLQDVRYLVMTVLSMFNY